MMYTVNINYLSTMGTWCSPFNGRVEAIDVSRQMCLSFESLRIQK